MKQVKILVKGVVQGVGFRPFCARTAAGLSLNGSVMNTSAGVEIILEGRGRDIEKFMTELSENPPSAAVITNVDIIEERQIASPSFFDFNIAQSRRDEKQQVFIPADIALCPDCLRELRDPNDRRFRYPFINCTLCGPRYSIIQSLPYDRAKTTMSKFAMCERCQAEYDDPQDRRFHAQPNACPACGPALRALPPSPSAPPPSEREAKDSALDDIIPRLARGGIVAIKGIGGFHIACIVEDDVISELRRRKNRPHKPFAIMVRDIEVARNYFAVSESAEKLLASPQAPIVICKLREGKTISEQIAPGQNSVGIMLPYTPIHHLIMENFDMLVMTSANLSDAPIISQNDDAVRELAGIADAFLLHDRDIETAIDDTVIRDVESIGGVFLRRARGFVPNPIKSLSSTPVPILAAGADIKSVFALAQDETIFASQYLGDLRQLRTADFYRRALAHFTRLYSISPEILAHDAHPDYFSTRLAKEFLSEAGAKIEKIVPVQHHAAHFAALLTESNTREPAIGVIFDGLGYGDDGNVWGGEFFVGSMATEAKFLRVGTLFPCDFTGGDKVVEEPWRYGEALLNCALGIENKFSTGLVSTSCGRLFDGVSALLSLCRVSSFEGHAAIWLESCADENFSGGGLPFEILDGDMPMIDWRPAVCEIVRRVRERKNISEIAGAFHSGLSSAVVEMCVLLRKLHAVSNVGLSGGVWQNGLLLKNTVSLLVKKGFKPILHKNLSPNDENIAVGQAALAML